MPCSKCGINDIEVVGLAEMESTFNGRIECKYFLRSYQRYTSHFIALLCQSHVPALLGVVDHVAHNVPLLQEGDQRECSAQCRDSKRCVTTGSDQVYTKIGSQITYHPSNWQVLAQHCS